MTAPTIIPLPVRELATPIVRSGIPVPASGGCRRTPLAVTTLLTDETQP